MCGELEKRFHDKMSRYTHSRDKQQNVYNKRGRNDNSKWVANTSNCEQYNSRRPEKDSRGDRKAPTMRNDKDFKPCHLHRVESKHLYDKCKRNPKNASKSSFYVKKCGHDALQQQSTLQQRGRFPKWMLHARS